MTVNAFFKKTKYKSSPRKMLNMKTALNETANAFKNTIYGDKNLFAFPSSHNDDKRRRVTS